MEKKITLKRIFHREKWRLAIFFDFDEKLKSIVRSIAGSKYSNTNRCFYVDDTEENLKIVLRTLKGAADVDISFLTSKEEAGADYFINPAIPEIKAGQLSREIRSNEESTKISWQNADKDVKGRKPGSGEWHNFYHRGRLGPVEFRISEKEELLVIKFHGRYEPGWIDEMRSYGRCFLMKTVTVRGPGNHIFPCLSFSSGISVIRTLLRSLKKRSRVSFMIS